jgi:hypothetical protein
MAASASARRFTTSVSGFAVREGERRRRTGILPMGLLSPVLALAALLLIPAFAFAQPAWTSMGPNGVDIENIGLAPQSAGLIFAAGQNRTGVWQSAGDGGPWIPGTFPTAKDVAVSPDFLNDHTVLAVGSGTGPAVFKSTDGGVSWTAKTGPWDPNDTLQAVRFSPDGETLWIVDYGLFGTPGTGALWRITRG